MNITINGKAISALEGMTILEAASAAGIHIPTLCHLKDLCKDSLCRVCLVEIVGMPRLMPACSTTVREGMEILTDSEAVLESRRMTVDFICRHHRMECDYCHRYTTCELHALVRELGLDDRSYTSQYHPKETDETGPAIIRDFSKCVLCRRCEAACAKQGIFAIGALNRGERTRIGACVPMPETGCIDCGQCLAVCPTGALSIRKENKPLRTAINQKKHVIAALSSNICDAGRLGKLISILRNLGIARVVDTSGFTAKAADLAVQALRRGEKGISPLCPAAAKHTGAAVLGQHPEALFHNWCKTAYAEENGLAPEQIHTLWITPCTALKAAHHCDSVITGQELHELILRACVSRYTMRQVWVDAPDGEFDGSLPGSHLTDTLGEYIISQGTWKIAEAKGASACKKIAKEDFDFADLLACPHGCKGAGSTLP